MTPIQNDHQNGDIQQQLLDIYHVCQLPSVDDIEDVYPCTPLQQGIMAQCEARGKDSMYKYIFVFRLGDTLDIDRLYNALRAVLSLSAILRTRIVDCDSTVQSLVQVVVKDSCPAVDKCIEISQKRAVELDTWLEDEEARQMRLGDPLFRATVLTGVSLGRRSLVMTMHHAICDNSSIHGLVRDVARIYHGESPEYHAPFKSFVEHCYSIDDEAARSFWSSRFSSGSGNSTPAKYPFIPRPGYLPHATSKFVREIVLKQKSGSGVPPSLIPAYIEAAWALNAATYTQTTRSIFGASFSGRQPQVLGGLETTLGPTLVTIPVQVHVDSETTVEDLVKARARDRRDVLASSALQFGLPKIRRISESMNAAADFTTLLNVWPPTDNLIPKQCLVAQWAEEDMITLDSIYKEYFPTCICLNFVLPPTEDGGSISAEVGFDQSVICEDQMTRVFGQFEHILQTLMRLGSSSAGASTKLGQLQLLGLRDRTEFLEWNSVIPEGHRHEQTLHGLVATWALAHPHDTAIDSHDGSLSYEKLENLANRLAQELRSQHGVAETDTVGLIFEHSLWAVVAMLAVLKAGGTCVPIDPGVPHARKQAIVSTSQAKVVMISEPNRHHVDKLAGITSRVVVSAESAFLNMELGLGLECVLTHHEASLAAYIFFTSGSTGSPKGVVVEHGNYISSLTAYAQHIGLKQGSRHLQFASYGWDTAVLEIFAPLLSGGCIVIPSQEDRESDISCFLPSHAVQCAVLTPTVIRTMMPEDVTDSLEILISVGEPMDARLIETWGHKLRLINGWGLSETAVCSSFSEAAGIKPQSPYPQSIGRPVGCAIWIVDVDDLNTLVPIGAVGEIVVEGSGVARGYLPDQSSATQQNPFIERPPSWFPSRWNGFRKNRRMFRTGDLGRFNPDGCIAFVGRRDSQVKIRGQRLDIAEVEATVVGLCPDIVREAVVTVHEHEHGVQSCYKKKDLVAVVCLSDPPGLPDETVLEELLGPDSDDSMAQIVSQHLRHVRSSIAAKLPAYMVPVAWIAVERLPVLSQSAKLDRKSVSEWVARVFKDYSYHSGNSRWNISSNDDAHPFEAPASAAEISMRLVWSAALSVPEKSIGRHSSFIRLGGDSISAMRVATSCRKEKLHVSTASLLSYGHDSLAEVTAACVNGKSDHGARQCGGHAGLLPDVQQLILASQIDVRAEDVQSVARATDAQAWMVAVGELDEAGQALRTEFTLESEDGFDVTRLSSACQDLTRHHAILRTWFMHEGRNVYQIVIKADSLTALAGDRVNIENIEGMQNGKKKVPSSSRFRNCLREHLPSFRLCEVSQDGRTCRQLRVNMHHALYDAVSWAIMIQDLGAMYLEGKPISVGDSDPRTIPAFHDWVSHVEVVGNSTASIEFWRHLLQNSSIPVLRLRGPLAKGLPSPVSGGNSGRNKLVFRVHMACVQSFNCTPSTALQAAWAVVLSKWCRASPELGNKSQCLPNDVVFGVASINRHSSFPGVEKLCGPCINILPVRARVGEGRTDGPSTVGSLIRQLRDQAIASIPHHHVGCRAIFKHATNWPSWARYSSIVVYQSGLEDQINQGVGSFFGSEGGKTILSVEGTVGDSADLWLVAKPSQRSRSGKDGRDLVIELQYAQETVPEAQARWYASTLTSVLESIHESLKNPVADVLDRLADFDFDDRRNGIGMLSLETQKEEPNSVAYQLESNTTVPPPSPTVEKIVLGAWEEVGLPVHNEDSDRVSMFSCGADLVTALLLSWSYQRSGYLITIRGIVSNPSRFQQATLLNSCS